MPEGHSISDSAVPPSLADDTAKIMEEHKLLKAVLARLEGTRDIRELTELLDELRALLTAHFEREERADGILRDMRSHNPYRVDQMAAIMAEHDGLLDDVTRLAAQARRCLEGPMTEIFEGVSQLKRALHDHEARESEVFLDAIYTDIGTAD